MKNKNYHSVSSTRFTRWIIFANLAILCLFTLSAKAQLTGTKNIPGDYANIAAAVTDLNSQGVGAGGVIFNVAAGSSETAPVGGINLTATGTSSNTIVFQKSGAGTNPLIIAPVGTISLLTTSTVVDGIFSFSGSDYVTMDGIDLQDNNASGAAMMEYGYGFFKASASDGCQNNTIMNCVITLNKANNVAGTTTFFQDGCKGIYLGNVTRTAMTTDLVVSTVGGRSNGNTIVTNTIQNVFEGIYMRGYGDGVSPYSNIDQNNSIGGNSAGLGNIIRNYGTGTLTTFGIVTFNQNNLLVQYNNINNTAGGGTTHGGTLLGMSITGSFALNNSTYNIKNNTITLGQGTNTAQTQGISIGAAGGTGTVTIDNNTITGFTNTSGATAGAVFGTVLSNTAGATLNITNNIYSNNQISGVLNCISLQATATAATANINGNAFTNTTMSNNLGVIMITNAAIISSTLNINNNNINGLTFNVANTATNNLIQTTTASATLALSISGNNFQNITYSALSTGGMAMIFNSGTVLSENISNNTFTNLNLNATGTVYLIYLSNSTAGSITVNNNSIVTAFAKATGASNAGAFYCLYNFGSPGSGTHNITNNTFSNITTHSTSTTLFGIYWQTLSGPTANISGNIVSNWNNSSNTGTIIGMATTYNTNLNTFSNTVSNITNGGPITGIQFGNSSTTTGNCYGNTISGLSSSGASSTVLGINVGTSSGGTTLNVFQNTINTLSGSGATSPVVTGIQVTLGTTVNIYKNKIYDLSQSGAIVTTSPAINGMLFSSGTTVNAYNNLIGDLRAPAASLTDAIRGISVTSTTANASFNVSYNTVNIAASSSGTNFGTTGIFHTISTVATTGKLDLRNNIIVNTSVPNGTGSTVAYRRSAGAANNLANYASGSNNNLFYAGTPAANRLIYFDGTSSAQTISNYRSGVFTAGTIAPRDAASVSENPPFLSVTGSSANFLHIDPTIATQVESAAAPVAGITDDFDGNTRNGSNPDIGADEGNFIVSDLTPPSISYSAFFNTSCLTDRTVSINITDATGVNTTPGTKPRLYFKKSADANTYVGNTNADNGWKYVEATNASSPFSFTTNYSLLQSAMAVGDVIQYFIVAQDVASPINIAINSGTFFSPPASVALTATEFPIGGTINSYTLTVAGLSGTVTIGAAGTYTSLTGAGGLFSIINSGGMSGNVTANILDATVAESGATALNAINYSGCGAGPFTLTIKPNTTSVLSGSLASNALIRLNGADNVIIDGSNSGGTDKSLTITNTGTTAPSCISIISLGIGSGATDNIIKNCNLSTGVAISLGYGISVGGATPGTGGADNDNVTLQNNSITVVPIGIYANGTTAVSAGGDDNLSITGNTIDYNSTLASIGIQVGNALNSSISLNTISEQTTILQAPTGISLETGFVSSSVTRNNITKALTTNTGGYGGRGITVGTGTATSNLTIANNFISGINGSNWSGFSNSSSMGIGIGMINSSSTITTIAGGINLYFNSVSMTGSMGSASTANITAALYVGSGASALNIRNNIFSNTQTATSATQKNYAIYSAAAIGAFTIIDNNDYYVSNSFNAPSAVLGNIGLTDRTTLAAIQTGFGGNANSISSDPGFISSSDLHISISTSSVDNLGTTIAGITNDFDGDTRCPGAGCPGSGTSPDIGADEYTPTPCTGTPAPGNTISSTNPACSGASFTLSLQNATTGSGVTYLWESADDAGFTVNLASIGTASTMVTSQTTAKYYRCTVTCSGNSVTSTPLLVTIQTNPAACYCGGVLGTYTNIGCNFGLGIEDVTVAGINNLANGCGGPLPTVYTDYTWLSGNVQQGQSYPITIGRGAFVNNACAFGVWVDWNNNNSFYDAGEFMSILLTGGAGVGQASNTGTLVVPAGATLGSHVMRIRSNFSVAPGSTTACASLYTYGETEDYIINVVNACAGTPVAGTTVSFSALACPNVPFTLYLQGVGPALGLTYQWESSPDNILPYLPIAGATNPYRVQTQNISTYYRCTITCSNGGGSASSTPLQMNMNTYANCICVTPNYSGNGTGGCTGTTANNYIGNVTFAGINNTTGCGANTPPYYMYFPSQIALVNQTVTYPITISAPAAGAAFQRFKVFIDFNDNASCDDPGEMVYNSGPISTSVNSTSGFISIAANAPLGTHKFRVRSSNPLSTNQDANSCSDDGYYGEVEEYQITISGPPPCTGTPAPGQTLASTPLACASTSINLSLQFATSGAGVTYQWQSSLNAGFSAPVNLGTSPTETVTQTATTWYRCIVTCSGSDGISTPVMVSYSVPCYCTNPVHGSDGCALGLYINNFTFAGINNTSGCYSNVPYTTPFYSYFPNSVATVVLGVNYPYSITTPVNAGAYTQFFGIWIDFNNNGSFDDAGELIASTTSSTAVNTFSGNYTIPLSSPSGVHKMRIRSGNAAPANSCSAASSGETEDYLIDIACSATASSNSPVCPGATINLSSTFTGSGTPVSYTWTGPNGVVPSVQNPTISSVTAADAGVYTVTITDDTGCSATKTTTVVISPLPDPLSSSNAPVCEGSPLNLFGDNIASGQSTGNSWSWSGPSFISAVQNPNVTGSASTANSGTYTLTVTNSNGCTASSSTTVVVNPNPVLSIATQTNITCNGDADGSIDLDANPGTSPFLFDLSGSNTLDGIYTGLDAGTYTANVIDDNGCEAASLIVTITEPDVLTVAAGSNSPVCTGTALNLTSTPAGGTAGFTYAWTGPNSFTSTAQDPTISSVTAADAGQYDLQVTDDHGCIANTNHTVTVIAAPTAAISNFGNNNICLSQPATVTLTFTGTGPWNYTVSDGTQTVSGSSPTSPVNINITPTTAGTHNYTVTAVGNAGCPAGGTGSGTATVFVSTAPPTNNAGPVTPSSPEACSGTVLLINTTTITGQNVRYSWNTGSNSGTVLYSTNIGGPFSPPPFQTTSPTVYAQFGALAGSSGYNVCVQGTNGCGSGSNKCTWIRGVVSVPGAISPANPVACPNNVKTYSCGTSAGATVYNWTLSGSATPITSGQGTQNVTVTFPAVFTSGQLCVTAALACGGSSTSAPRCMTISNTPAVPGTMTGPAKVCPGATGVVFSVAAVTGATGYNWTVPAGCTITSGTNTPSITVNFPNPYTGAPPVCVSAASACASSAAKCKTVGTNLPGQPGAIAGPVANICNSTVQYSIANVPGATSYNWINPAGTTITSGQLTTTILLSVGASFTTGNLTVTANTTACTPGTSLPRTISIAGKPNQPGSITANPAIWCTGGFVNFSVATVSPLPVYNWTTSNGTITAGQGSNNIDVTWGATAAGTVNVTAGNTCGTSTVRSQSFSSGCREEGKELAAGSGQLTVYPNPAHDKVTVSIYVKEASQFNIKLRDISGRVILSEDHEGTAGLNAYDMELKNFAKGIYTLEVQSSSERWKTKVVVE